MANDIVNINVSETTETVAITVNPNLTTVNINRQVPVGVNGQDLQSVTDIGATTTNGITINVAEGVQNGISSTSSQGFGVYGSSSETFGVYGSSLSVAGVYGNSDNGYGVQGNSDNGIAVYGNSQEQIGLQGNSYNGTAIFASSDYGTGLFSGSTEGIGISAYSTLDIGLEVNGNGTIAIEANLGNSNKGLVINSGASSTGNFIELDKNGVDKLVVNQQGELTATKLIKQGGTSSQFLMADGSVSTGGGGGGATNLSTTQTASNFTINSDTGDDALIPLGNGTLAGATLNNYTTAEKNKLTGIATGAEVNVNADWNATSGDAQILNKPTIPDVTTLVTLATPQTIIATKRFGNASLYTDIYGSGGYLELKNTGINATTQIFPDLYSTTRDYGSYLNFVRISNSGIIIKTNTSNDFNVFGSIKSDLLTVARTYQLPNKSGTLVAIDEAGTSSQILAADGSVITAGTNITITGGQISSVGGAGGGGSSVNYYLNGGTSQGTFGGTTYYEFSKTAVIGTGADFNISSDGYIASFITDVADPSLLLIPGGNWNLEFFFSSSSAGGSPSFYVELYKYDGTSFTLITSSSATAEGITGGTSIDAYFTSLAVPETILTVNDRLAIRVFVNASSKTITLHTQNGHLCEVITTFTAGLTALNGLQAQVQNFATGTTGTDFAINSSGSTHTFNLPSASATARGVVTTASQTFAGDKTFSGAIGASNLSGTNTGDQDLSSYALLASPTFTGTVVLPSTTSIGTVSSTEIGYLDNVTSSIQTQLDNKIVKNIAATYTTNTITTVTAAEYAAIGTKDANTLYFIV